jgi:hypothetical protein
VLVAGAALLGAQTRGSEFSLYATIVDGTGAPAAGLTPDDLQVIDGGAVATITGVERLDWPLSVQLLIDNGAGLESSNVVPLRNGVRAFFETLPAGAEVTVVTTAARPSFLVRPTTARDPLFESVGRLAPDGSTGRLLEALDEATERIERRTAEQFSVIVALATTLGDDDARDSDLDRVMRRLDARPVTVHVVQYMGRNGLTTAGAANQAQIALAVTRFTKGRYESINSATRLASLLPEIGDQVAKSYLDGRMRITVERPEGATGELGALRLATRDGLKASGLAFDARLP